MSRRNPELHDQIAELRAALTAAEAKLTDSKEFFEELEADLVAAEARVLEGGTCEMELRQDLGRSEARAEELERKLLEALEEIMRRIVQADSTLAEDRLTIDKGLAAIAKAKGEAK